jgi:hypothetical protein
VHASLSAYIVANRHTMDYNPMVKNFSWDEKKKQLLIDERNISFEEVIYK